MAYLSHSYVRRIGIMLTWVLGGGSQSRSGNSSRARPCANLHPSYNIFQYGTLLATALIFLPIAYQMWVDSAKPAVVGPTAGV